MTKGCGLIASRIKAHTLTHGDQKSVTSAILNAIRRKIGDAGGWGWDRRDSTVVIHPVVAATLALLAATTKRKPPAGNSLRGREAVVL
ncbi:Uncharacterised protein [Mycobacteroides abscessus subsp. bolletii]|nr:Uncharacterised protein [Mycobacteroides abscessus subsp. bolletii]